MSFTFDYSSMLSGSGKGLAKGIADGEFNTVRGTFEIALKNLSERRTSKELPFWDLPFDEAMISGVETFAENLRGEFKDIVHLGIGGSALGPIALHSALNHPQHNLLPETERRGCRFFCPDNVDPDLITGVLDVIDPRNTVFHVVSKSGGTAETISQFMLVVQLLKDKLGKDWNKHLVITTDPAKGFLRQYVSENGIQSFPIEPEVGGRFTVLTPVGLFPAAMTGIDIQGLCEGARKMSPACFNEKLEYNPAAMLATLFYLSDVRKKLPIEVIFAYSNRLYPVADWFRQLWAESLGKRYDLHGNEVFRGPTPVKAIGATDQHSQVQLYVEGPDDKVVLFLGTKEFNSKLIIPNAGIETEGTSYLAGADFAELLNAERQATSYALTKAGRLNMTLEMDRVDAQHVGALLYMLEAAVMYAGALYRVNPLDQPGVEAGKNATYALMGKKGYETGKKEILEFMKGSRKQIFTDI